MTTTLLNNVWNYTSTVVNLNRIEVGAWMNYYILYMQCIPFIADSYLSWCEYDYMTKKDKTDNAMAKLSPDNCKFFDIWI